MFRTYFLFICLLGLVGEFCFSQCSGSLGDPIFSEGFGSRSTPGYGMALPAGTTTYTFRTFENVSADLQDGEYTIATSPVLGRPEWFDTSDITVDNSGIGYMLIVNASFATGEFYRRRVTNLCNVSTYEFSANILNVLPQGFIDSSIPVNVTFQVQDTNGLVLGSVSTGDIFDSTNPQWRNFAFEFNLPNNTDEIDVVLINNSEGGSGNDLAIDEIQFRTCGPEITLNSTNLNVFDEPFVSNTLDLVLEATIQSGVFSSTQLKFQQRNSPNEAWLDLNAFSPLTNITIPAETYFNGTQFRVVVRNGNETNSNCFNNSDIRTVQIQDPPLSFNSCFNPVRGFTELDAQELYNLIDLGSLNFNLESSILLAADRAGIMELTDIENNPRLSTICRPDPAINRYFELAVNSDKDIFLLDGNVDLFRIDKNTCQSNLINSNMPISRGFAMSFDQEDNLYVGGPGDSRIYRFEAGNFTNPSVWVDFNNGEPAGDFVQIGNKLYISWILNGSDVLFEVTVDADNQYVSHVNLGSIARDTFGLAAELGVLYGITRRQIYSIDLPSLQRRVIINNPNSTNANQWFGGAGLNEALDLNFSIYAENELNEALNGDPQTLPDPLVFNSTGSFTFYIRIEDSNSGQFELRSVVVNIETPPAINSPITITNCVDSFPENFNLNSIPDLIVSDPSQFTYRYYLDPTDAEQGLNTNITSFEINNATERIFVRVENERCFNISEVSIESNVFPTPTISGDLQICSNASTTLSVPDIYNRYVWSGPNLPNNINNGNGTNEVLVSSEGTYTIEVFEDDCNQSKQASFNLSHFPNVGIEAINVINSQVEIVPIGTAPFEYSLDGFNYLPLVEGESFLLANGDYTLFLRDVNRCTVVSEAFTVFSIPNFISPNGDGVNDSWQVRGLSRFTDAKIKIYDRYGKLIFEQEIMDSVNWNGTYLNRPLPSGNYWYELSLSSTQTLYGFITIKQN